MFSPLSVLQFYRLDEACSEVGDDDTAFSGGRSPRYAVFIIAVCPTPQLLAADRAWARSFWEALRPHSPGAGSYINAMTEFEDDRVRAAYGPAKYDRLARVKAKYDPRTCSTTTPASSQGEPAAPGQQEQQMLGRAPDQCSVSTRAVYGK